MLKKVRENLYVGDAKVTKDQLAKANISVVLVVGDEYFAVEKPADCLLFFIPLHRKVVNRPHVKDLACHIPKYMVQNGETVAVISPKGMVRAPWVVSRAVCEIESKTIYEILMELTEILPKEFKIGEAYL